MNIISGLRMRKQVLNGPQSPGGLIAKRGYTQANPRQGTGGGGCAVSAVTSSAFLLWPFCPSSYVWQKVVDFYFPKVFFVCLFVF